jgi:uncharacterized ion transporter superfamily protein YfcC
LKLRVPHTFTLLFVLVALAAVATHFIPAGEYTRVERDGRRVVDPSSYHRLEPRPAGPAAVFMAYPRGLVEVATIVFYIFIIGGAFGVVTATGAVEASIGAIVRAARGNGPLVLAVLMTLFSLGGGTIGLAEETLPFLPALVMLARRLGYDDVTGAAVALVGAGAGFAGAFMGYRLVVWAVTTCIAVAYVLRHAARTRAQAASEPEEAPTVAGSIGARQRLVLLTLAAALGLVVVGAARWQWGLLELAGLFVAMAVVAGVVGGLGGDGTAEAFLQGATGIAAGALVVGLARGVLVILDGARVTDTILHGMAGVVAGLPAQVSIFGIYAVQVALSYLVPSASGQAALSLPILVPLADMVGVTRQTSVLAYQMGDGFSNIFAPTSGYFMAALALSGISWPRWARFMWPLQLLWLAAGLALLFVAHAFRWGPY